MYRKNGAQKNLQSMNDSGNVTQDGQTDVDEEIGIASSLEKDTEGRQDEGKNDLADIAVVIVSLHAFLNWKRYCCCFFEKKK